MADEPSSSRLTIPQMVLPLPGALDGTPLFHSNSPEIVLQSGILLSTFPADAKASREAHLDHPLSGRFDVFFHHITNASKAVSPRTLYLGLVIGNSLDTEVHVRVLSAISYLTRPDAPFTVLPAVADNAEGKIFAGPGDRVAMDLLRESRQEGWTDSITLGAHEIKLVCSLAIPVNVLFHQLNGRTGFISLEADGPVYMATLSSFAHHKGFGQEREPGLQDWLDTLTSGALVEPRDKKPTVPNASGELIYGRVAGVAGGSTWRGLVANDDRQSRLSVADGQTISFPISTVHSGTLGTNQVQSAQMLIRYEDTAYKAHGNYGVLYDLDIPLYNDSDSELVAGLSFQSPVKNWSETNALRFLRQPPDAVVFRGTVKFQWQDKGVSQTRFIHLVQKQGQMQDSLIDFTMSPKETLNVKFTLRYPADCTPPHVLTIVGKNNETDL